MTSNTGPILVFPRIQPFGSVDCSSLGKVHSLHFTGSANCKNSSVCFVMKYCPTSTVFRNPASVQIFINRSGCGSLSTRSFYFCNKFSQSKVQVSLSTSLLARKVGHIAVPQQVSLSLFDSCCILHTKSETAP